MAAEFLPGYPYPVDFSKDPAGYRAPCKPGDETNIPGYCRTYGAPLPPVPKSGPTCINYTGLGTTCAPIQIFTGRDVTGAVSRTTINTLTGQVSRECLADCGSGSGFFGFGGSAGKIVGQISGVVAQGALAALSTLNPAFPALQTIAAQTERSQKGMSLNISQLLGGIGQAIGGISNPYTQTAGQFLTAGANIASAFAPQPVAQPGPIYQPQLPAIHQQAIPVSSGGSVAALTGATAIAMAAIKPILAKVASALGRRGITLTGVITLARRLGKFFASPEAIALYLGITVSELAQLITTNAARKHRRMNPANGRALNRAARRIRSFHRMCQHVDLLKTRRRSSSRCGTCKRSPCRC